MSFSLRSTRSDSRSSLRRRHDCFWPGCSGRRREGKQTNKKAIPRIDPRKRTGALFRRRPLPGQESTARLQALVSESSEREAKRESLWSIFGRTDGPEDNETGDSDSGGGREDRPESQREGRALFFSPSGPPSLPLLQSKHESVQVLCLYGYRRLGDRFGDAGPGPFDFRGDYVSRE